MRRLFPAMLLAGGLIASALPAQAQWFSTPTQPNWWNRMCTTYEKNRMWPAPFIAADRDFVCEPFNLMVMKGWHRQNLLGAAHFDPLSHQLTTAGEMKVRSILTYCPPDRQTIFIEKGLDANTNVARVDAVQQTLAQLLPGGQMPEVIASNMMMDGWPAEDVDAVSRGFDASRPAPRMPAAINSTGGDSGQ